MLFVPYYNLLNSNETNQSCPFTLSVQKQLFDLMVECPRCQLQLKRGELVTGVHLKACIGDKESIIYFDVQISESPKVSNYTL